MNEDGSLGISHNASQEGQTPTAKPVFSSGQEGVEKSSADASAADDATISHDSPIEAPTVNNIAISHDSPIEAPTTTTIDAEPVDIFASPEEQATKAADTQEDTSNMVTSNNPNNHHIANSPFSSRNHFQSSANTTDPNIPQFFNDAIIANTPIEQPKKSKKGLIIGSIIGCLVLVGVAILLITATRNKITDNGETISSGITQETKKLFYRYANLLLTNTDSDQEIKAIDVDLGIAHYAKVVSPYGELDRLYFSKLKSAYNAYLEKLKENNTIAPTLLSTSQKNEQLLNFVETNPGEDILSYKNLAKIYLNEGEAVATAKAKSILNIYRENKDNEFYTNYYNIRKTEFDSILSFLNTLSANNCIVNGTIDEECGNRYNTAELTSYIETSSDAVALLQDNYQHIGLYCIDILNLLSNNEG